MFQTDIFNTFVLINCDLKKQNIRLIYKGKIKKLQKI